MQAGALGDLPERVKAYGVSKAASELGVGEPTLRDVVQELLKPGRDIRDSLPKPILRTDVLELKDLREGMRLTGTVRNVIDFGAFVDVGVHQDGLVHISEIADRFIRRRIFLSDARCIGEKFKSDGQQSADVCIELL